MDAEFQKAKLIVTAILKVKEYPFWGEYYFKVLQKTYLSKDKSKETDILYELDISRSTYYKYKKDAVKVFGYCLWQIIIPNMKKMKEIRARISEVKVMDRFDRAVFESIVKKVIIGEVGEDGKSDPYKITFVLKGLADFSISDARKRYKNLHKQISK